MLGEPPRGDDFAQQFDWQDSFIEVPFDCRDIARVLAQLDADPQRLERIRRANVRNSALRHDWLYRIQTMFRTFGLEETEAMAARAGVLQGIAAAT